MPRFYAVLPKSKQQKQKEGPSCPRPDPNLLGTSGSIDLIESDA